MRGAVRDGRRGFTLAELLVTVAVILVMLAMLGSAVSAARNGTKANTTGNAISRLDQIVTTQFRRYETRSVPRDVVATLLSQGITNPSAARAWHIRRNMITAEMPDRWSDVAYMAANPAQFTSPAQQGYIATFSASNPSSAYGGAECLFMIVMQGGFADCLDCNGLVQLKKGDKDGDGALEFWDDWNNPIDYILWAPGYRRSGDTSSVFSPMDDPFPATSSASVRPGLGMRPLIYSAGPDGKYGLDRNDEAATLDRGTGPTGRDCGNQAVSPTATSGAAVAGTGDTDRSDNVVNVEQKGGS